MSVLRRRIVSVFVVVGLLTAGLSVDAQQPAKAPPRVGMLIPVSARDAATNIDAFLQGLRELGHVDGKNINIEYQYSAGNDKLLPDLAAELIRRNVDVIVTWGTPATGAAKKATSTIPIVMAAAVDPVGTGLVATLARPGGNVTGVTTGGAELSGKSLDLLREIVPRVTRIAVLWNPANPVMPVMFRETQVAAQVLRVQLQSVRVSEANELDGAFVEIRRERPGALLVLHDPMLYANRIRIVGFAVKTRLPAMYERRAWVDAGGLMSSGVRFAGNFRRAATFVDKLLKGARPADMPVENPTWHELVINMKSAKALGLTIPPSVLARADEVIQ